MTWAALMAALDRLAKDEETTPCQRNPHPWTSDEEGLRDLAISLCADCPILSECGAYAAATSEDWGVWGGVDYSPTRRRKRRRERP